jgi:exopolysaccharide biosynthesis polyprenyl glycosylphosphotransferase
MGEQIELYQPVAAGAATGTVTRAATTRAGAGLLRSATIPMCASDTRTSVAGGARPLMLGKVADVGQVVVSERVDRVVLAQSERRGVMPVAELLHLKFMGVKIEDAHSLYERMTGRILLDHLSPSWLILSEGFRKPRFLCAMKRLIDVALSGIALVLGLPVIAIVSLAIYIESGSPVLFRQTRVGRHDHPFEMLKLRSMRNVRQQEANWTEDADKRITGVGQFIRKFRLDELPQFINVLRGDMSLVGPRPEQPSLVTMLEEQIPYYAQRHSLRPGITGWAQVKYGYGATIEQTRIKLEHDLFYIKHMSLALDLAIIFETGKVLLSGRGGK